VPERGREPAQLISFPTEAFFTLQDRLAEHEAEGVAMPAGIKRRELALRILVAAEMFKRPEGSPEAG
jgi:hypothetical protein